MTVVLEPRLSEPEFIELMNLSSRRVLSERPCDGLFNILVSAGYLEETLRCV
jgi:hypothetical protein